MREPGTTLHLEKNTKMNITKENIAEFNKALESKTPTEIVKWAINIAIRPIVTTNFGPYSASILKLVSSVKSDIDVIWCDTGYNTSYTYLYAEQLKKNLSLQLHTYTPLQTASQRDTLFNGIPQMDDPKHILFTEQVKLEPFRRALKEHQPDVWFTNIRKGQTAWRDSLDILSLSKDGILKVSPFYRWTDQQLGNFLSKNNLQNETRYFDPTKVLQNRECGLHL